MGELLGDYASNPRSRKLISWCQDRELNVLNQTLSHGQATFYDPIRNIGN